MEVVELTRPGIKLLLEHHIFEDNSKDWPFDRVSYASPNPGPISMYGFLADLMVGIHVAYVGYVVVGLLLIVIGWILGWRWVRNFWFRISHLVMMLAVVLEEIMNIRCPLSVWEESFRLQAGQPTTGETFMGRILHALIFYDAPPIVFTVGYFAFGALVLATFLFCVPRSPIRKKESTPVA